jgi:hypothetical protein
MNYVPATGAQTFGPFFGVDGYNGGTSRVGMGGVDAKTGEVLIFDPTLSGSVPLGLQPVPTGLTISGNAWHDFGLSFDYTTQKYFLYVDGLSTTPTGINFANLAAAFTDADLAGLSAAADAVSQAATGTAYFVNFSIATAASPLPEPAAMSFLAMLALGFGLRRNRRV